MLSVSPLAKDKFLGLSYDGPHIIFRIPSFKKEGLFTSLICILFFEQKLPLKQF